jgi:hypothetical protein
MPWGRSAISGGMRCLVQASCSSAALSRRFSLSERYRLEARFEAFNMVNHTNFAAPAATLSSSSFGRITSQAVVNGQPDYRTLQFALKIYF